MLQRLKDWLSLPFHKPWLSGLVFILFVTSITSLHPSLFFLGWDNFSSYLDVPTSVSRSLLGPWRDYRGLGVASDSEVVDLPRQLIFGALSGILPKTLIDQVYLLGCLWFGVLLMYGFASWLYQYIFPAPLDQGSLNRLYKYNQAFGFFAAFFYLFNLNTLSVFYFPIAPYLTRFAAIPALNWLLFSFFQNLQITKSWILIFIGTLFLTASSYLTATVFITIGLALFIHSLAYRNLKRWLIFFGLLLGLNAFWLVPFGNYTLQKSALVEIAPANVEGNESLLNRSVEFFSPSKQLIFYPNFFDMKYTDPETKEALPFHPLAPFYQSWMTNLGLFIFPLLYISGGIFIAVLSFLRTRFAQYARIDLLIWIPIQMLVFIVLSLKEYGPTGPIYSFLANNIPFFKMLFRFGDTKFHPFIVFAGALAASLSLIILTHEVLPRISKILALIIRPVIYAAIILSALLIFRGYFSGLFVGQFMYTKIPQAYFDIAKTINQDPVPARVLQLPFDKYGYWRPYTWGYFGSSFWHYLINKPFIDRTFEPASQENIALDNKIYALLENTPTTDEATQKARARTLYQIIKEAGVKYLIVDETVNTRVLARDQQYWGRVSAPEAKFIVSLLAKDNLVKERSRYNINPYDYLLNDKQPKIPLDVVLPQQLVLYELVNPDNRIDFVQQSVNVDPNLKYLAETAIYPSGGPTLVQQLDNPSGVIVPFQRRDPRVREGSGIVNYELGNIPIKSGNYQIQLPAQTSSRLVKVRATRVQDTVEIKLFEVLAPSIQNHSFENLVATMSIPLNPEDGEKIQPTDLRLRLENQILSLPSNLDTEIELGAVLVHANSFGVEVLKKSQLTSLTSDYFKAVDPPDCLGTRLTDYRPFSEGSGDLLRIESRNGSICVTGDLVDLTGPSLDYGEISLRINLSGVDLDQIYDHPSATVDSQYVDKIMKLPKPNNVYVCIEHKGAEPCGNPYIFFSGTGEQAITLPFQKRVDDTSGMRMVLALRNIGYQEQKAILSQMKFQQFDKLTSFQINLPEAKPLNATIYLNKSDKLSLSVPKTLSVSSSYNDINKYNLTFADAPCEDKSGYRSTRTYQGNIVIFAKKCGNGLFYSDHLLPNEMYLWLVDYNLISGQFPSIRVFDALNEYTNERISLYQGYPNIEGFKQSTSFSTDPKAKTISTTVGSLVLHESPKLENPQKKVFSLSQYSENDGVIAVKSINVVAMPSEWGKLTITAQDTAVQTFNQPTGGYQISQIMPSLWKVQIGKGTEPGRYMLQFKNAFDKQWRFYDSINSLVFGVNSSVVTSRCSGLYNCYEFSIGEKLAQDQTVYLFYEPLKLAILGVIVSVLTVGLGFLIRQLTLR